MIMKKEEGTNKAVNEKPEYTQEQLKRMAKEQSMQFANYKKRLRESVEIKELQVKEIELNIAYYEATKAYAVIENILMEEEARNQAQIQKEKDDANKPKLEIVKTGVPRTEEEIKEIKLAETKG